MIKAVLFDFDDTLVKTKVIRFKALKHAGKEFYNLNITDEDIEKEWGLPFNQFISNVLRHSDTVENLTNNYRSILHEYPNESFDFTNDVIKELSSKYLLAIISSSNPKLIESGIKDVGMDKLLFNFIQSSEDTDVHKPNPNVFNPAIDNLNKAMKISHSEILYVGDAIDDFESATKAKLNFCGIANRTVQESKFKELNIPYITDIRELPNFVLNIK